MKNIPTAFRFFFPLLFLISASAADVPVPAWDPKTAESFKSLTLEQLFTKYEAGYDFNIKRSQAAYLAEIVNRSNLVEFLSAKLRKTRGVPDTREVIAGREKAITILGKLGERARPAIPLLVEALEDSEDIRNRVANALSPLGPIAIEAKPALLEELHFQLPHAASALFRIDPASESTLEAVIAALADTSKNQMFRHQTVEALSECQVKSDRARKYLEKLAADEGNPLANAARQRLQVLDWKKKRYRPPETALPPAPASEKEMLELLSSNPNSYETATKLAKCSSDAKKEAVAILLKALREKRVMFPSNTISMIGLFGPEAKDALPFMIEYAASDEAGPANTAMAAIGEIGPDAIEAKPVVERALLDASPLLRWRAANTLCLIDPVNFNRHLEALTSTLKAEGEFSDFAIQSIGKFGARASKAEPFLTELLKNEKVRLAAGEALLKVQPTAHETVARAIAADLKSDSVHTQDRAAKLLAEIGPPARDALPALREAAAGSDVELAKLAREAIAKIETK